MKRLILGLVVVCAVGCGGEPVLKPAATPTAIAAPVYPYPDCELFVSWIKKQTPDPASVEILDWRQKPEENLTFVKFRAKNEGGGLTVYDFVMAAREGKVCFVRDYANGRHSYGVRWEITK